MLEAPRKGRANGIFHLTPAGGDLRTEINQFIELTEKVLRRESVTLDEIESIRWQAEGELDREINKAWIKLQHYCFDSDIRAKDPEYERGLLTNLAWRLEQIRTLSLITPPLIFNENVDPTKPGKIGIFSSSQMAQRFLAASIEKPHLALDSAGTILKLVSHDSAVVIKVDVTAEPRPELAQAFLQDWLRSSKQEFRDAADISMDQIQTATLDQLRRASLEALARVPSLADRLKRWWRSRN
jgi:hypothetical protein